MPLTLAKKQAAWLFVATAALIYSVIYFVSRLPSAVSHAPLMSAAATIDLTITVSAAFYFLLVRRHYASWFTIVAVAFTGLRSAEFLLPSVDQPYLFFVKWVSAPLELVLIILIARRVRSKSEGDTLARIRAAASAVIPYKPLADIVGAELAVLFYALCSWRCKPETSQTDQVFSCAEASGYGLLGGLVMLLTLCEGVPIHFVLMRYSVTAAWIFTSISLYCLLWAMAIIRAVRLRTILVNQECVKIRVGIIWEADIPRQDIVRCQRASPGMTLLKTPGYLKAVVLNDPQYIIELRRPIVAFGLYGNQRVFTRIGIAVDQAEAFGAALNCR